MAAVNEPYDWDDFLGDRWQADAKGDDIKGIVVALGRARDTKNRPYPVVTLRSQGRDIEVHATAVMLKTALAERAPQIGDGLHITLTELRQTGQPSPLKVFSVVHKTAAQIEADRAAKTAPAEEGGS